MPAVTAAQLTVQGCNHRDSDGGITFTTRTTTPEKLATHQEQLHTLRHATGERTISNDFQEAELKSSHPSGNEGFGRAKRIKKELVGNQMVACRTTFLREDGTTAPTTNLQTKQRSWSPTTHT